MRADSPDAVPFLTDPERRRHLRYWMVLSAIAGVGSGRHANALSLGELSQQDAAQGLRGALEKGAEVAVQLLGREDGFWGNDKVRIPLPDWLVKAEKVIKLIGRSQDIDALKVGVNRAAEQAVPQAKKLLVDAVRAMNVQDAKAILTGGDDSVTAFFKDKTRAPLTERFLPVVGAVTGKIGLAQQYNSLAAQVQKSGLVKLSADQANVERHVTTKALDGLYWMIGEEERKLRQNPAGAASAMVRKVFGSLR